MSFLASQLRGQSSVRPSYPSKESPTTSARWPGSQNAASFMIPIASGSTFPGNESPSANVSETMNGSRPNALR